MAVVTMRQLLEAGVHFGHQTRRWNPKMKRFIFGERNGIYIIDLNQTLQRVDVAYSFVRDMVAGGGNVLFIGTKKQSQDPISRAADQCGMPFVNERWLGGMLTNFTTIAGRVKKMQEYERMRTSGDFEAMPKKEALILTRELEKLQRNLGGIRDMSRLPDAVFIIDIKTSPCPRRTRWAYPSLPSSTPTVTPMLSSSPYRATTTPLEVAR
jgi:small subunit ribosomal protein S2